MGNGFNLLKFSNSLDYNRVLENQPTIVADEFLSLEVEEAF